FNSIGLHRKAIARLRCFGITLPPRSSVCCRWWCRAGLNAPHHRKPDGAILASSVGIDGVVLILSPADLTRRDFRKILLIKLSAVGDVVHTIPVLNKLRRRYPMAQLDWLVTPGIAELLRHHSAITNVIEFDREAWSTPWRFTPFVSYARLAAKLSAASYDLVIDMHGQFRTAALTLASGAPARIGFDRPRASVWDASPRKFSEQARKHAWQGAREGSWLAYTHHIPVATLELHAVDRYLN